jgi:hypothetical protein
MVPKTKSSPPTTKHNKAFREDSSITSFDISGYIINTGLPLGASIPSLIAKSFFKILSR